MLTAKEWIAICLFTTACLGLYLLGVTVEANATAPCATKAQFAKVDIGDRKAAVVDTLNQSGTRTLLFKWDMSGYPPAWSDFRDFKRCDGKTVTITFHSYDKKHWKVESIG